jgi:cyanate permease
MYMGIVNTGYSGSFFVPTIIREMGYTSASAQIRSIPIFVVAAICSLIAAWLTDRLRHRFTFCIFGLVVASIGYIMRSSSSFPVATSLNQSSWLGFKTACQVITNAPSLPP